MPTNVASIIETISGMSYVPAANERPAQIPDQQRCCQFCNEPLGFSAIECSACGGINLDRPRRRQEDRRPSRERVATMQSQNLNGQYTIYRNSDNSLSCDCLSFLFQRGVENGVGFSTCKHVRQHMHYGGGPDAFRIENSKKPTQWQLAALKRLGISASEHLTDAQAYFIFADLLRKQGVEYKEYESLLRRHQTVNLLPLVLWGVEFEGGVDTSVGLNGLARRISDSGIACVSEGYNHTTRAWWKITTDGSIIMPGWHTLELVSPKKYGMEGFQEMEKATSIWNEAGSNVNATCGCHFHHDFYGGNWEELFQLALVWTRVERLAWYFVQPSRRSYQYCKPMNAAYLKRIATASVINAEGRNSDRYHSLNACAFDRHGTVEVRLYHGTTNAKEVKAWAIFCLMLIGAVRRGLKWRDLPEPLTIEGLFDKIGMNEAATSVVRDARGFLMEQYRHWEAEAHRNPGSYPQIPAVDLKRVEREVASPRRSTRRSATPASAVSQPEQEGMDNGVHYRELAVMRSDRIIPSEDIQRAERPSGRSDERAWRISSSSGGGQYTVRLRGDGTVTCDCRGFRGHHYCYHSIAVSRFLLYRNARI